MAEQDLKDRQSKLSEWVEKYSDQLYGWALQRVNDPEQASDLVQETYYAAMKSGEELDGVQSPKSWLYSILKRKTVDHYRKKKTRSELHSSDDETPSASEEADFDESGDWADFGNKDLKEDEEQLLNDPDFLRILDECYGSLPEKYRTPLLSKYQDGRKGEEIRQETGLSATNYWQIIRRAKLKLRDCLDANWFKSE